MILTLLERHTQARLKAAESAVVVMERSLRVADEVFIEAYRGPRTTELDQISSLAQWGVREFEIGVPTVYLKCRPATMMERVRNRGRMEETCLR